MRGKLSHPEEVGKKSKMHKVEARAKNHTKHVGREEKHPAQRTPGMCKTDMERPE